MVSPSAVEVVDELSNLGRNGTTRNGWVEVVEGEDRLPVPLDRRPDVLGRLAPAWPGPPPTARTLPYKTVGLEQVVLD
eukprot:scaffold8691_cov106-Isochrysis_galbana.AAC.3